MDIAEKKNLELLSIDIREKTLQCISSAGVGHVGGALSIADLLAVLYGRTLKYRSSEPKWSGRDFFVLSKGHAGPAVYATLAIKGFFPVEMLKTLNKPGTNLPSHMDRNKTPGVDMTTGSLGQGTSTAAGMAYALKLDKKDNYVFLVVGDGECNEGQVWECAMFCAHNNLSNLIWFIDENKKQVDGQTKDICNNLDLVKKFEAFGFNACRVDGHDVEAIDNAISTAKLVKDRPSCIVLDTVKGKGISRYENAWNCHSVKFTEADLAEFIDELEQKKSMLI